MEEIVKVITIDTRKSERSIKDLKDDIKALKKELESTTIGSKEFDLKLTQLGQLQKEYKAINEEIVASSKPVQKQMFELARFGENLAKSYSAINAAMGLISDGNEDVQLALAKTARWIQLIQGLSGFKGLLKDIPKLVDNFKNWFKWLDPISDRVDDIAEKLSGIDASKLSAVGSVSGPDKQDIQDIKEYNVETEKQNSFFGDYNDHRKQLNEHLQKQKANQEALKKSLEGELGVMYETASLYNEVKKQRIEAGAELAETDKMDLQRRIQLNAQVEALKKREAELAEQLKSTNTNFIEQSQKLAEVEMGLADTEQQLAKLGTGFKRFGKTLASTIGWTLLITAILTAISALWKWISGLQTAAKKQRELNKAINEGAASISSKGIVTLKELARRYREVGDSAEEKTKFLEKFKKKIEETGLAVNNIKEADEAFINNTGAYIQALKDRAKAQAIENEAVKIYEEYLKEIQKIKEDGDGLSFWQKASMAMMRSEGTVIPDNWEADLIADNIKKANEKVKKETEAMEKTLNQLFDEMFDLETKSGPYFNDVANGASDAAKAAADAKAEELKTLVQYYKDARRLFMDARTRELDEVREKYDEQIALAKKHNQDTTLLEQAKQREIDNIIKKYNDERLAQLQADAEKQYQVIQEQINRIRMMNDTSNLGEPQEQSYTTEYKQGFGHTFMAGSRFFYQSGEDVQNQYDAQIEYNNQLLALTKSRIEQENALLNQQLEIEGITADKRLEIERTLRENEMALSDAAIKNEADNIAAYKSLQDKKNQAVQSTLSVASDVFGAMATLAGEETKAGKAFAVTQAIIDTYSAANSAYSSMAGIPYVGPALGIAAAAAAVASGIANVKNILSTKVSSDVNSVSISSGSAATPPAISTPPIEYTRNLLGDKETDELNKPIKCYVLESDITDTQNKVKVTEDNASF